MCKNIFHEEPCNCDNTLYGSAGKAPSEEHQFKSNYTGILNKDAAWRKYKSSVSEKGHKRN